MQARLEDINIRVIDRKDNWPLAKLIRSTLKEFGANHPGTVYYDESTDHLLEVFGTPRSIYYVAEFNREVVGGGGIFPTEGLPADTCELVKMYTYPYVRGIGLGSTLIKKCIDYAKEAGYKRIYLETMPELKQALKTYEKFGFEYLNHAMGNSGHFGCDLWMLKELP
ncbi:MAG TPA: GNAT family N-acetyltransferase [Flavisolibacter sp.]|jgi:putative acetyltransferase|nr:GNAT family N-acetyltransferase [Flavisolibacter sp.]